MGIKHECQVYGKEVPNFILCSYYRKENKTVHQIFGLQEDYELFKNIEGYKEEDFGVWRRKMSESEFFKSERFAESYQEQVKKDTWYLGLPMIYMENGVMIEEYEDGRKIIKQ